MNIEQAKAIRLQILERRNYLRDIDIPLKYSKRSLYGGMQERVRRKADKVFKKGVTKRKKSVGGKLQTVDKYIRDLSDYNVNLSIYEDELANYNESNNSVDDGLVSVKMSAPVSPIAPKAPKITLPSKPKKVATVRRKRVGIRSRRFK